MSSNVSRALMIMGVVVLCLASGVIGGALSRHLVTSAYTMSFADFVSIMLMASTLIITALAVILAVLGFVGWSTIENRVHTKTNEYLTDKFKEGEALYSMLEKKATEIIYEGIIPATLPDEDEASPTEERR